MRIHFKLFLSVLAFFNCVTAVFATQYQVDALTTELDTPWALEVIAEDTFLISERSGALKLFQNGTLSQPLKNVPEVYFKGQGGMLDIALSPDFDTNQIIFISYSSGTDDANTLVVSKARLNIAGQQLDNVTEIFKVMPTRDTPVHYGGRIAVMPDASLIVTSGDGFDYREFAQKMDSQMGKMLRFNVDGSPAAMNPFNNNDPFQKDEQSQFIWTLGHRNPQALLFDAITGMVISHEHGPAGGDEINILQAGKNYGWPVITNGKDYSGANISPYTEYEGMEQPWFDWTPSVAPSDMILYRGDKFPELQGKLLVTTLKTQELLVIDMEDDKASQTAALLTSLEERLRGIQQDKAGNIYLLSDSGKLLRLKK